MHLIISCLRVFHALFVFNNIDLCVLLFSILLFQLTGTCQLLSVLNPLSNMSNVLYPHVCYHYFFSVYSLELDQNCQFDFLAVYDGLTTNTGLIGKVCGISRPTFQSSSNGMTVVLSTDYANSYRGFSAQYTSILPDPPEPDSRCIPFSLSRMSLPLRRKYRKDLTVVTEGLSLYSGSH